MIKKRKIYFITGSADKALYFSKLLGIDIPHKNIELDEIQSMNLKEIVRQKMRRAYRLVGHPVLVEDVSLEFEALNGLPGPFVKFFVKNMSLQDICDLLKEKDREARARCIFGCFDGEKEKYFEGGFSGKIAEKPKGENGFGWDKIFIPDGYGGRTRAELNRKEYEETYLKIKPIQEIRIFIKSLKNDYK